MAKLRKELAENEPHFGIWKTGALVLAFWTVLMACGTPAEEENLEEAGEVSKSFTVLGHATMGSKCPRGTISGQSEIPLEFYCRTTGGAVPIPSETIELMRPLQNLKLQADCTRKIIYVEDSEHLSDSGWEMMPNGVFSFTVNGGDAKLRSDGMGHTDCTVPLQAQFSGQVLCKDADVADIEAEIVWWTGASNPVASPTPSATPTRTVTPTPTGTVTPSPTPTSTGGFPFPFPRPTSSPTSTARPAPAPAASANRCAIPPDARTTCWFYAAPLVKQCQ